MRNFNPELGKEVAANIASGNVFAASFRLAQLVIESEVESCLAVEPCEVCDCCSIRYNDSEEVATHLERLLAEAFVAPFDVSYGVIFPKFICIARKYIEQYQANPQGQSDGDSDSEPSVEQSTTQDIGE